MHDLIQKTLHVNGIELHITLQGSGPLVIFCHGFPGHWSNWRQQLKTVAEAGYTGIAPDMRGYGKSSRPKDIAAYTMDHQIADMCGLLDALGARQAVFVGHDFGAALAWNMALREPTRVAGVIGVSVPFDHDYYGRSCLGHLSAEQLKYDGFSDVLVASPVCPPSAGFEAIAKHQFFHAHYFQHVGVAEKELDPHARDFLTRLYWGLSAKGSLGDWQSFPSEGTGYLDVLPEAPPLPWSWMTEKHMDSIESAYLSVPGTSAFKGGLASYRVADRNWAIGEKYAACQVDVPALFIAGELDPVMQSVNADTFARMEARVTDLTGIEIIPNAGHFVQLEQAVRTSACILAFLEQHK